MVLYPNKLPESERVCSGICIVLNPMNCLCLSFNHQNPIPLTYHDYNHTDYSHNQHHISKDDFILNTHLSIFAVYLDTICMWKATSPSIRNLRVACINGNMPISTKSDWVYCILKS